MENSSNHVGLIQRMIERQYADSLEAVENTIPPDYEPIAFRNVNVRDTYLDGGIVKTAPYPVPADDPLPRGPRIILARRVNITGKGPNSTPRQPKVGDTVYFKADDLSPVDGPFAVTKVFIHEPLGYIDIFLTSRQCFDSVPYHSHVGGPGWYFPEELSTALHAPHIMRHG